MARKSPTPATISVWTRMDGDLALQVMSNGVPITDRTVRRNEPEEGRRAWDESVAIMRKVNNERRVGANTAWNGDVCALVPLYEVERKVLTFCGARDETDESRV
jgi:hypothetical protein